jgi:hypothetical protein
MASTIRPGIPPRRPDERRFSGRDPQRAARADRPTPIGRSSQSRARQVEPRPLGRGRRPPAATGSSQRVSMRESAVLGPRLAAVRPTVKALPNRPLLPSWLRSLLKLQKTSLGLAVVLATATVGAYGWSVYSQQLWGKEYSRLQQLRHQERQLTASSEMLKHDIAKHVNASQLGLVPQSAEQVVFLKSAPERQPAPSRETAPVQPPAAPLGY